MTDQPRSEDVQERGADEDLTSPGRRTGSGAASVIPYLNRSLQTRPRADEGPRELSDIDIELPPD
jgi:hypothetical protein